MFGRKSLPGRNYSYGTRVFRKHMPANTDLVDHQLRLCNWYSNQMVQQELERREEADAIVLEMEPRLQELADKAEKATAEVDELVEKIKGENQKARKKTQTPEQKYKLKTLKIGRSELWKMLKALRKETFQREDVKERLKELDAVHVQKHKDLRKQVVEKGLYWGSYVNVEMNQTSLRRGRPPKFHRYDGTGSLAVQMQGGLTVEQAMSGKDTRLTIGPLRGKCRVVGIRIGTNPDRTPIWYRIRTVWHREIPEDAMIKWAYIDRTRMADRHVYKIRFCLAKESWDWAGAANTGCVGLDVGWRVMKYGLRIGYWIGDDGETGEITLPKPALERFELLSLVQCERDVSFNRIRDRLVRWMKKKDKLPDHFLEMFANLPQWRSANRLREAVANWHYCRVLDDDLIFAAMEKWRKWDKMRWQHEQRLRKRVIRDRDNRYRNAVAKLAGKYATVAIEDTNWATMQRKPGPEEEEEGGVRQYTRIASVGRLLQFVKEKFRTVKAVDAKYTTQSCHQCGHREKKEGADLMHRCSDCNALWDQDLNAAVNLLRMVEDREHEPVEVEAVA